MSPWLNAEQAGDYVQRSKRFLAREVRAGRLRAAAIGGRRELFFRTEWLDEWLESQATPVLVRRRA
ncbi:MAG: hypothetical protein U0Q11_13865 [Vicinamibacterales bacterium]